MTAPALAMTPVDERPEDGAKALNLHQRLVAIRRTLKGIAKGGQASAQMGGYRFAEWDGVAGAVGDLFAEYGIVIEPSIDHYSLGSIGTTTNGKPIYRAEANMVFVLKNSDDPEGPNVTAKWAGVGDDSGDKSLQKACTSAQKYWLLKLLQLRGLDAVDDSDANDDDSAVAPVRTPTNGHPAAMTVPAGLPPRRASAGDCPECERLNLRSSQGRTPRLYFNDHTKAFQCNGVDGQKMDGSPDYVNHTKPR